MGSIQYRLVIAALFIVLSAQRVSAEDYSSEQDFFAELPVVLSASRLSQPLSEAPNAMTVIDRNMIRASGFRNISDIFRLVPGMYVGYLDGHTPIVAYHGSTDQYSRRMQVLVDGRSVYLPSTSSVSWEDIPLLVEDIERIEVVRGPAAASHGANSLQGVVNIITRDASSVKGASASLVKGSGGVSDASLQLGEMGSVLDYRASLAFRADDGFATNILNDDQVTRLANLRANYHPNVSDNFDFQAGYSDGKRGLGTAGRFTDQFREARAISSFQQVTWLHTLAQQDELKLNYYHIYRNYTDDQLAGTLGNASPENHVVNRHEVELQHTAQLGASNRLVWGGGTRMDSVDAPNLLIAPQALHQSRLFAHDEWRMVESVVLNAGAMFENDGMGHHNTSPRVALNYHLTPQHTLRISTSVAYRSPAALEEKGDIQGQFLSQGGLRPEKIHSKEIGYLGEFKTIGISVDGRVYYDQISDIIYMDPSPAVPPFFDGKPYGFANLLSATYHGIEGTIKYSWAESGDLTFNYSRQSASCAVTGTLREPGFLSILQGIVASCISMVPLDSGSILLVQRVSDDVRISAGYYYQGQMELLNTFAPLSRMRRLDFRVAKSFGSPHESGGEVALVVQNAFRNNYTEYNNVTQTAGKILFDRRAYVTATLRF